MRAWGRLGRAALALGEEEEAGRVGRSLVELGTREEGEEVLERVVRLVEVRRSSQEAMVVGRYQDGAYFATKWVEEAPHCRWVGGGG